MRMNSAKLDSWVKKKRKEKEKLDSWMKNIRKSRTPSTTNIIVSHHKRIWVKVQKKKRIWVKT